MRILLTAGLIFLFASALPVGAADPSQIFGTIIDQIGRQIERKKNKKLQRQLTPIWQACSNGDVASCDRAAQFPLNAQGRADIARMRDAAIRRPDYERSFYACQKMNITACNTALAYPYASNVDRRNLRTWRNTANQQHQQVLTQFRKNKTECYAGSISACDAALVERRVGESAIPGIQRQRALLHREAEERRLHGLRLEAQRKEYRVLRGDCTAGKRRACKKARAHTQMPHADISYLERRDQELTPIFERVVGTFNRSQASSATNLAPTNHFTNFILAVLILIGAAAGGIKLFRRFRMPALVGSSEPSFGHSETQHEPASTATAEPFPLSGHMPTDVRRALYGS